MIYEVEKKVNDQVTHFEKTIGKAKKLLKKSQPLRIMMTHTRQRNLWLQAQSKSLQRQVKELKVNMEMMKIELEKKGLERGAMEKTIEVAHEETAGK